MKIGITSQNFRTITGHAGKARRFLIYEPQADGTLQEVDRWDFPKEMSMHEYRSTDPHPVEQLDILITGGCGQGFRSRLERLGVTVIATSETDPLTAAVAASQGESLPPAEENHDHHHHGHSVSFP